MRYLFIKDVLPLPSSPITRTLNKESFSVNFGLFHYPLLHINSQNKKPWRCILLFQPSSLLLASDENSACKISVESPHRCSRNESETSEIKKKVETICRCWLHTETQVTAEERAVCNAISRDLQRCQRLEIGGNRRIRNTWPRAIAEGDTLVQQSDQLFSFSAFTDDFQTNLLRNVQYVER